MKRFFAVLAVAAILAAPIASATAFELNPLVLRAGEPEVAPAPSIGSKVLELITSPTGLGTIVTVVMGVLGGILSTNEIRRRRVALGTYHAFHIVEDLSKETENTIDDKVAAGLKALDEYMIANGWRALKPGEQPLAKLGFQSLNGASKLAEKVATEALKATAPAAPAVPPSP